MVTKSKEIYQFTLSLSHSVTPVELLMSTRCGHQLNVTNISINWGGSWLDWVC